MVKDPDRFKKGRKIHSAFNKHIFTIDKVDLDESELSVHDDFGYACRIFLDNFDDHYYFLDDAGTSLGLEDLISALIKCECGSDAIGGSKHSEYCAKYEKD